MQAVSALTPDKLERLAAMGLTTDQIIEVARMFERKRSPGAIRQARYRESHKGDAGRDVTSDVTRDVTKAPFPAPFPPNPPIPTPTRKEISTRARGWPEFWLAYPRKVGKGAAEKAYSKALALIGGPDPPGALLAALERVKPTWTEPQFIPHASTWLNEKRWEDEPEPHYAKPSRPERITSIAGLNERDRRTGGIVGLLD